MTDISFIKPCASLCGYVRHFYTLTCDDRFSLLTFPIGCPQIIFHRGTPLFIPELSAPQDIFTISGQVNFPAHITTGGNTEMIVAVFYPHTIGMFIDTPPSEFYNREISGYDIGDRSLCELAYKVFDAENSGACIKQIEQWLLSRLNRNIHLARMEQIGRAVDAIMACPSLTVGKLADDTCLSRKQFERVFNSYIGMMP